MEDRIIGTGGLTGRADPAFGHPQVVRRLEFDEDEETGETLPFQQPSGAMPSNCRRVRSSPHDLCPQSECPGHQRNGDCLLTVVAAARAAGVKDWRFDVDPHDGFWDYAGPDIPGYALVRGDRPGEVVGQWEEGAKPADPVEIVLPDPQEYDCPHCGAHVAQNLENFHWWCPYCGRNAKEET